MRRLIPFVIIMLAAALLGGCGIYTFKDVSIPAEIQTINLHMLTNKARYVNPVLAPRLTSRLQEKIVSQTRLTRTDSEDADWVITGYINDYNVATTGISNQQVSTNQLRVGAVIRRKDNKTQKEDEFTVTKSFEFPASQTVQQAEAALGDEILKGVSEEIFNRLFSNW